MICDHCGGEEGCQICMPDYYHVDADDCGCEDCLNACLANGVICPACGCLDDDADN